MTLLNHPHPVDRKSAAAEAGLVRLDWKDFAVNKSSNINAKLKDCEPEVQEYVKALRTENSKLQRRVTKFEVKNLSPKSGQGG